MLLFYQKLLGEVDCCTSVLNLLGQVYGSFYMFVGTVIMIWELKPIIFLYLKIIGIVGLLFVIPALLVVWYSMKKVTEHLKTKQIRKKARALLMIYFGGTVFIGAASLVPFYMKIFGSDQLAFTLSLAFLVSNLYASLVINDIPVCHMPYKENAKSCVAFVLLNVVLFAIGEAFMCMSDSHPSPHPSGVMHIMVMVFFGPATVDFWISARNCFEMGKRI